MFYMANPETNSPTMRKPNLHPNPMNGKVTGIITAGHVHTSVFKGRSEPIRHYILLVE